VVDCVAVGAGAGAALPPLPLPLLRFPPPASPPPESARLGLSFVDFTGDGLRLGFGEGDTAGDMVVKDAARP
jgi:hypothetical protein